MVIPEESTSSSFRLSYPSSLNPRVVRKLLRSNHGPTPCHRVKVVPTTAISGAQHNYLEKGEGLGPKQLGLPRQISCNQRVGCLKGQWTLLPLYTRSMFQGALISLEPEATPSPVE